MSHVGDTTVERVRGSRGWRILSANKNLCIILLLLLQLDASTIRVFKNVGTGWKLQDGKVSPRHCAGGESFPFVSLQKKPGRNSKPSVTDCKPEMKSEGHKSK